MRRAAVLASALLAATLLAAACGSGGERGAGRGTTTTSYPVRHAAPLTEPSVSIGGKTYPVPTEEGGALPGLGQAIGSNVVIRDDGVLPEFLVAPENARITWTNLSSKPARVHFLTGGMADSPAIPVGGTFTYSRPGRYNFAFRTSTFGQGQVYVGAFAGAGS